MHYEEHRPSPHLRPWVRCLWSLCDDGSAAPGPERVVPDGCAELVLHRGDPFRRVLPEGGQRVQPRALAVGQFERALTLLPSGRVDLVGIRFEPHGLHALLGIPMDELVGCDPDLAAVDAGLCAELERAADRPRGPLRTAAIEQALSQRFERRGRARRSIDGLAAAAVRAIDSSARTPSAGAVAAHLRVSLRSLERAFRTQVGLTPKRFLRVQRLQRVLGRLGAGAAERGWAELALDHGYADQPHLIRDFRLLVGASPERYLAERTDLAACFVTGSVSPSSNP